MPPRRTVLRAAGWASLAMMAGAGLSGCRIRLQDDAPTIPFISRQPIPDEDLLVSAYRRAVELAAVAARASGVPLAAEVTQRHTRQAQTVRAILAAGLVPDHVISGPAPTGPAPAGGTATSHTATTSPTAAGAPAATAEELGHAARDAANGSIAAAGSFATHRALGVAIAAHDAAEATSLGAPPDWPTHDPLPPSVATALVEVTRACEYALQVAAAHLLDKERAALLATLVALSRREATLTAGLTAGLTPEPKPALGYRLPFPVAGPEAARRLVVAVLGNLVDRGLDGIERIPAGSSAVLEIVRLQAEAVTLAVTHGVVWPTMPGMALG